MEYPLNDKVMAIEMKTDLMETYNYTEEEAQDWIDTHGSSIISSMWDAYCHYMGEETECKNKCQD